MRTPALLRSSTRFRERFAHIGCILTALDGVDGYCSLSHAAMASVDTSASFHYLGGFSDSAERDRCCCICLYNRCRGRQVGVPNLSPGRIFSTLPYDQQDIFSTTDTADDWLFFTIPPARYKAFDGTKVRWKSNPRRELTVEGLVEPEPVVFRTTFNIAHASKEEPDAETAQLLEKCKNWHLYLFQCQNLSLYCLSKVTEHVEGELVLRSGQANKNP